MNFLDNACDLEPSWLLPGGLIAVLLLLAILIIVVVWPIGGRIRIEPDVMAATYGDQPRMPS